MSTFLSPLSKNAAGDRIEHAGDITLNLDYWDCACEHDFIHPIAKSACSICGATQEESPSSRENEVQKYVKSA